MNVYVKLKSVGKRRPVLDNTPYILPDGIATLRQLIETMVRQEVDQYNSRGTENMLVPFLTEAEICEQSSQAKFILAACVPIKKLTWKKLWEPRYKALRMDCFASWWGIRRQLNLTRCAALTNVIYLLSSA